MANSTFTGRGRSGKPPWEGPQWHRWHRLAPCAVLGRARSLLPICPVPPRQKASDRCVIPTDGGILRDDASPWPVGHGHATPPARVRVVGINRRPSVNTVVRLAGRDWMTRMPWGAATGSPQPPMLLALG